MKKRFEGNLEFINPEYLVSKEFNKLESFFIGLGLIFNDLKGCILFENLVLENYEPPLDSDTDDHRGNFGGILLQINRLMAGVINEFFIFLEKNPEVLANSEFKDTFSRLNAVEKGVWTDIFSVLHGETTRATDFLSTLAKIRSNIAFHYDHSGKFLHKGYVNKFFNSPKEDINKKAYFSIGEAIKSTRFYFSDAAAEEALFIADGKQPGSDESYNVSFEKYRTQINKAVEIMAPAISSLLENYIQSRRNRPH